jgi:hypothetical protein
LPASLRDILKEIYFIMLNFALLFSHLLLASPLVSQQFDDPSLITSSVKGVHSVHAADINGDGNIDALSGSIADYKLAWYENLGNGSFGQQQVIASPVSHQTDIISLDLNGDGDLDLVVASNGTSGGVHWYENLGGGSFGAATAIGAFADGATGVCAGDLDGDGDLDILSNSTSYASWAQEVAWFENLGGGTFGAKQLISSHAYVQDSLSVLASDFDGDGDLDVFVPSIMSWFENSGSGVFGVPQLINSSAPEAAAAYISDLNGDGHDDLLLSHALIPHTFIAWHAGDGTGSFGAENVLLYIGGSLSVLAVDLDNDGDLEVLATSSVYSDEVYWFENLGNSNFGPPQIVTNTLDRPRRVTAADFDNDGDQDLLTGGMGTGPPVFITSMFWHENLLGEPRLSAENFVAGTTATIKGRGFAPGGPVRYGYSFAGPGPTSTPLGTVLLSAPMKQLPAVTSDIHGHWEFSATIPPSVSSGTAIWLHAYDFVNGVFSNGVAEVIL